MLQISAVMRENCRVHVDDALCYKVAHQCSMVGFGWRQTNYLGMRRVGIEFLLRIKRIVDNPERVQLLGYLA